MIRKFAVPFGVLALSTVGLLGTAPNAGAGTPPAEDGVRAGTFYLYQHDDYKGYSYDYRGSDSNFTNNYWNHDSSKGSINDGTSSVQNHTDRNVVLWQNAGYTGDNYFSKKNSVDRDLSNNHFDNKASSIQFQ
ncbi:peptidase inhibitor family I36 protein [Streptomyces sp. MST-110588]|uniref:peptidase inhibitor family I36 protein n=1 Tax=Streptomyces sp. MST-110588 TaxID=2833628 RepID=UPI001F5D6CD4|nr:peptidase inhibitor family I36 protein [Streptomyces sp. MST-110588]UNO39399.1 peptidase inhibitor family I36 protein [Streptomyces sp. MST-110588]